MAIRCLKLKILFADVTESIDLHSLDKDEIGNQKHFEDYKNLLRQDVVA